MNKHSFALALVLPAAALCAAFPAAAAAPAGQLAQLSGFAFATPAGGGMKVLASRSTLEVGDSLSTEQDSYARVQLPDGSEVVLGPNTRVQLRSPTALVLATGRVQVTPGQMANARLTVEADGTTVDASRGSALIDYLPDPRAAMAQRAYARASLATASGTATRTDADAPAPVWDRVAQGTFTPPAPGRPPGLTLQGISGVVTMSNPAGNQTLTAGQFGYTANRNTAPSFTPNPPTMPFSPPPSFNISAAPGATTDTGMTNAVDCEVR